MLKKYLRANGNKEKKIISKWGINEKGWLAKPSEGGFGVITEDGQRVGMFEAEAYFKED